VAGYWLFKTEPTAYSYDALEKDRRTTWDGVKNPVARKHLAAVARGDLALIYHTGDEKAAIGVAKAISAPYPDPKQKDDRATVIDIAPVARLARPVTLAELKTRAAFAASPLARQPRLSVMPITPAQWKEIERLSKA
jgi:predicted RNA-binding protein with PUA-like domain